MKDGQVWRFWSGMSLSCARSNKKVSMTGAEGSGGAGNVVKRWGAGVRWQGAYQLSPSLLLSRSLVFLFLLFVEIYSLFVNKATVFYLLYTPTWQYHSLKGKDKALKIKIKTKNKTKIIPWNYKAEPWNCYHRVFTRKPTEESFMVKKVIWVCPTWQGIWIMNYQSASVLGTPTFML